MPQTVLDDALKDENRIANVALNKEGKVVGFFVLHRYYQHEGYDTPNNVVYVRSLSVNEKFQGHGYGTKMMMFLPEYVQALFPDFTHLYLVVDAENQSAWNVYERAGFMHTATKRRRTYWERKTLLFRFRFKTCIFFKAKRGEVTYNDDIHVINLLKDDVKVGFIALEQNDNKMNISAIKLIRKIGMRELQKVLYANYQRIYVNSLKTLKFYQLLYMANVMN